MRRTLLRRIPRALLVTLVALLVFGSTAAVAGDDEARPAWLGVAEAEEGDAWSYAVESTVRGEDERFYRFEVRNEQVGPRAWQDRDGAWRVSDVLATEWHGLDFLYRSEHLLDDGVEVAARVLTNSTFTGVFSTGGIGPLNPIPDTVTRTETLHDDFWYGATGDAPCSHASDLQGARLKPDAAVSVSGTCEGTYRFDGVETLHGMATTRFVREEPAEFVRDGWVSEGTSRTTLWFTPHVPYPVRVDEVEGVGGQAPWIERSAVMTGFIPGVRARPVPATPADEAVPAAGFAPRPVWGIDDDGIDHPFPLSEAWQMALDEPDGDLREFLAKHPGAAVVQADFRTYRYDDHTSYAWSVLLADAAGEEHGGFSARRNVEHDQDGTLLEDPTAVLDEEEPAREVKWYRVAASGFAPAAYLPERMPTVASLVPAWNVLADDDRFDNYGVRFLCPLPCDGTGDVVTSINVGRQEQDGVEWTQWDQVFGVEKRVQGTRSLLSVDGGGTLMGLETSVTDGHTRNGGMAALPAEASPERSPDQRPVPLQSTTMGLPTPQAAGVAAAALLAGLLYWLWPVLKSGGAVGLFSRLRRDELLEHPVRAAILDAVRGQPGIHHSALVRLLGRGKGAVEHHLRKLEEGGLVVVRKSAGRTCYFERGAVDAETMAAVPHLSPASARVLAWVVAHPGRSASEVARGVGVSDGTMSHHVRRLREAGLLLAEPGALFATHVGGRAVRVAA